jgi:hypothetical protein
MTVTTWVGRAVRALLALMVAGLAAAPPAWAHGATNEPSATNYVSRVTGLSAPAPGVTVRMVDATSNIEVRNDGPGDVIVLGYQASPIFASVRPVRSRTPGRRRRP